MTSQAFRTIVCAAAVLVLVAPVAHAQQRGAQPQPPPAPPPQQKPAPVEAQQPSGYSYKAENRRDPFVSLIGRAPGPNVAVRPSGLAGVLISEATVTGIWKGASGYIATLRAPDNKTYIVKPGEKLLDGTVKTISATQVVFSQDVNDPLSLVKQREIPKSIRPGGGESN
jgi:hypothetical protein